MNKHYHNNGDNDGEKIFPTWFYLPDRDECKKYTVFVNNICSQQRSHRFLIARFYGQNDFKTFSDKEVIC